MQCCGGRIAILLQAGWQLHCQGSLVKKEDVRRDESEDGFCINDAGVGQAFGELCLPQAAALTSLMFKHLLDDEEGKTLETWNTIFRHLSNRAKDAEAAAFTPLRGGGRTTNDVEDRGLVNFYTDLKTPGQEGMAEDGDGERESPAFGASSATKDARFDHLRTSLALVKGELGTRASKAPYDTMHGGLQGAFTALAMFEERPDSKASSTRVNGLLMGTNACYNKSMEACQAVEQLVMLGSISKVVALKHEVHDMSARTRVLETTLNRASKLMEDLSANVANLAGPGSGVAASGGGVTAEEYLAFKALQEHPMASIHQELKGAGSRWGALGLTGRRPVLPSRGSTSLGTLPTTAFPPSCMPSA